MGNLRWQRGSHRQGKEMMSAVYGFVLALTSFLILKTVNPALVDFTDIKIAEVPIIGQDLPEQKPYAVGCRLMVRKELFVVVR